MMQSSPQADADPISLQKPLDPGRVNTMDPVELHYWCLELGCSEELLTLVVDEVGEHVAAVRERLSSYR
jgi:hypothetical protein